MIKYNISSSIIDGHTDQPNSIDYLSYKKSFVVYKVKQNDSVFYRHFEISALNDRPTGSSFLYDAVYNMYFCSKTNVHNEYYRSAVDI